MSLSNVQYDSIINGYSQLRLESRHELNRRFEEIRVKCPEILDIDNRIAIESVRRAKMAIMGDPTALSTLAVDNEKLSREKQDLLVSHGYPADYLEPRYKCPFCKDTGFINGVRCSCFNAALSKLIYADSNIMDIVNKENFSSFDISLYSDLPEDKDAYMDLTPRENIIRVVDKAKDYIRNFNSDYSNLLIYGNTGVGKTFLTNCIAKELLDTAHTVLYYTAFSFFDHIEKIKFHSEDPEEGIISQDYMMNCDLLIIDDLGTELTNSFTSYALYSVLNERSLRQKSTIISTNLSIDMIAERYSERVFSRISKDYKFLRIIGRDIRRM